MSEWWELKQLVEQSTGFSMDALHVVAGVAVQLFAAALLRSTVARWVPWLIVLALELLNEISDFTIERWPDLQMQLGESVKDVLLTMALPTLLLLAARIRPALFARR